MQSQTSFQNGESWSFHCTDDKEMAGDVTTAPGTQGPQVQESQQPPDTGKKQVWGCGLPAPGFQDGRTSVQPWASRTMRGWVPVALRPQIPDHLLQRPQERDTEEALPKCMGPVPMPWPLSVGSDRNDYPIKFAPVRYSSTKTSAQELDNYLQISLVPYLSREHRNQYVMSLSMRISVPTFWLDI